MSTHHFFSCLKGDIKKSIFLVCLAVGVVGVSYGSLATAYGFPLWVPIALSILVLAGASEFMFIGIIASGGNPLAAAAAGLLVNARHLPFGVAVRELVGNHMAKFLGCHIMNDESVVFGMSQATPEQRKAAYWLCGIGVTIFWPLGTLIGSTVGKFIPTPETIGLDAVFPTILLAMVIPSFKNKTSLIRASSGAAISLSAIPFAPVGLPVLLSLLGLLTRKK
ncbi:MULTISPECIES: AzlC family ABC transporter permease [Xenorhabdus]|uniref:AzlC family ABC transporter permease n=1 Tax=Xenorhabdus TaxID=626 RepID=UPI0006481392|nr:MULTISPECIES: AzlC family ABC transporter permease [Xenorhabdus]